MSNPEIIRLGWECVISQAFPGTDSGDSVTVKVIRISDGYTWNFTSEEFDGGDNSDTMEHVSDLTWKAAFTPPTADTYMAILTNTTKDVQYTRRFIAKSQQVPCTAAEVGVQQVVTQHFPASSEDDTVTVKVVRLSDGYTWNFSTEQFENASNTGTPSYVSNLTWKATFTPPTKDKYQVIFTNNTLDVQYFQDVLAESQVESVTTVDVSDDVTPSTMLTAVNRAIQARLNGGAVQSYSIGGRNLQYASLSELYKIRDRIQAEVNSSKGLARNYVQF